MKKIFSIIFITLIIFSLSMPVFANDSWPTDANQTQQENQETNNTSETNQSDESLLTPTDNSVDELNQLNPVFDPSMKQISDTDEARKIYAGFQDVIPEVSVDDAIEWANRKGFEIIHFLQVIVQPFAIIIFIISSFITLIGSIGRGDLAGKGMWGMVISVIVYAVVLYAPVILQTFVGWISS